MSYFIAINGVEIEAPADCTWGISDISSPNSGRTLDGVMHKDIIAQKRKLTVKWGDCTWAEARKIINYCKSKGVQLSVTYPDLMAGGMVTKNFYTGDCTAPYRMWAGEEAHVGSISCDFIEI